MKLVLFGVVALVLYFVFRKRSGPGTSLLSGPADCYSLLRYGVPARGILLSVGSQRSAKGNVSQGFYEVRSVSIDVEIPGSAPYQCACSLFIPANLRPLVLPGATLELRVDPRSRQNVAVFGPGVGLAADFARS